MRVSVDPRTAAHDAALVSREPLRNAWHLVGHLVGWLASTSLCTNRLAPRSLVPALSAWHLVLGRLLLRTDVHRLYDTGYVTVTPDGHFLVSRRIKDDFDNGEPYMPFHGQRIWMPGDPVSQPNREALEWHAEEVFLG